MCATVASIIVAAATASSGRLVTMKNSEQAFQTVSSATKILKDKITDKPIVVNIIEEGDKETIVCTPSDTIISSVLSERLSLTYQAPQLTYKTAENILRPSEAISVQPKRTFNISLTDDTLTNHELLNAEVSVYIDREMNLRVGVRPATAHLSPLHNIEILFKPKIKISEKITENDNNRTVNADERVTKRIRTVDISWGDPVVEKGVFS